MCQEYAMQYGEKNKFEYRTISSNISLDEPECSRQVNEASPELGESCKTDSFQWNTFKHGIRSTLSCSFIIIYAFCALDLEL